MFLSRQQSNLLDRLKAYRNPQELYDYMLKTDKHFREFVDANKGKSAEQIAKENGIDLDGFRNLVHGFQI